MKVLALNCQVIKIKLIIVLILVIQKKKFQNLLKILYGYQFKFPKDYCETQQIILQSIKKIFGYFFIIVFSML